MLNLKVIVGSTREDRFSEKILPWLEKNLAESKIFSYEILDLRDYPLPYFEAPISPAYVKDGQYATEEIKAWAQKIGEADAYLIVTPEYNHGYSAVLKNALDVVYGEWNKKAISFISYGSVGGGRAVEQLRQVAIELQMAPIRSAVHIQAPWNLLEESGKLKAEALESYTNALKTSLEQLKWWSEALKTARNK